MTGPREGRRRRTLAVLALPVVLGVVLTACTVDDPDGADVAAVPALLVASGPEPEAELLAHTVVALLAQVDVVAEPLLLADGRSVRQAIELGDAELAVVYSGEEWLTRLGRADPPTDPLEGLEVLADADLARGLRWLLPDPELAGPGVPANATFAFFVAGPPTVHADLRSLSELSLRLSELPELSLCVDPGFAQGSDGLAALLSTYSVRRDRPFVAADPVEAVRRVRVGDCVAGLSSATDGEAWRAGLRPLADDLRFFPAFVPVPLVRATTLERSPAIEGALRPLVDGLSTAVLGRANARIAAGEAPEVVAGELAEDLAEELAARLLGTALTDVAPAP